MTRSNLVWGAALALVLACASSSSAQPGPAVGAPVPSAPAIAGKAQIGDFGLDIAGMDRSVAPGDDFYGYVNGVWARNTPIPTDKSSYGEFTRLADQSRARTRDILEHARLDPASKIGIAYATYLDTTAIEVKGLTPIQPWLARIKALPDKTAYPALVAEAARNGIGVPFDLNVDQDAKQPTVYAVGLSQGGLGLPDRDYYLKPDFAVQKSAYQAHLATMLTLAGESDAAARAKAIVDFETAIATVHWSRVDSRDATKTYNKANVASLASSAPGFDFTAFMKMSGRPVATIIVAQPSAIAGIARLINAAPLGVLKDQLLVRSLDGFAGVLPSAFDKEHFAFYGKALSGTPEQEVRWKRGVNFTTDALTDDVSKIYVAQYFPPETKAAADRLVANIIAAMNARIDRLTWMSAATKVKAHAKLAAFTPKIGYPSQWHDYSALTITPRDALGNAMRANQWQYDYDTGRLGQPIRRWEWGMPPMEVNAYANFSMVEIVFPASILQPPFFDPHADPAVNYGGIGAVIGHEMSHHFDDQGAKYDAQGRLTDWWSPDDVRAFTALEARLAAQYDAYEPMPGVHVNGKLTLGENSADLAGLTNAYDAYHMSLGGRPAPVIDGFTGDQRFYLGWAQVWRQNVRPERKKQLLVIDPHSPTQQRADIVRNMDAWYAAFKPAP
ncbi:MAG: M13 family metallopeptidase, partial [Pseudomonadota bacterium]|nr:M13 family metallopeptidase [Pseudomonadota bacterium]